MTKALMVDIETLSSRVNAHILSIGAVRFDPNEASDLNSLIAGGRYALVDNEQAERHIDPKTVVWWMQQSEEARAEMIAPTRPLLPLRSALESLSTYARGCDEVWSHGLTFDLVILQDAYNQLGMKPAWHYHDMRDTRTLFSLLTKEDQNSVWPENPKKHHPLYDAACQAVAVQRAIALLRGES